MGAELALSARWQSQTLDEGAHLYAGYRYWRFRDFGANPEHPPLVKLVAALPLLFSRLKAPEVRPGFFKTEEFLGGTALLYQNNADSLLYRARMAASIFALALALLIFTASREMFGAAGRPFAVGTAFSALLLAVFEPNLLANGPLVMTDMGVTCCFFAGIYAFYRYVKRPTLLRLAIAGGALGLTLAAKHSGVLLIVVLFLLACSEVAWPRSEFPATEKPTADPGARPESRARIAIRFLFALAAMGTIGLGVLWAFYTFRFEARAGGYGVAPTLDSLVGQLRNSGARWLIPELARWHVLPESYLYGLADVAQVSEGRPAFLFGHVFATGQWFYFPAAFLVKSTVGFLLLLLLSPLAKELRGKRLRREMTFLFLPPATYLCIAMTSKLNIGLRHILPIYPFLLVVAGASAWSLARRNRWCAGLAAAILLFHGISSLRSYPDYLPYSNEFWGGSSHTYLHLSDSSVDAGQGLKEVRRYLAERQITDCWFAYVNPMVPLDYYQIPCRPLPSGIARRSLLPLAVIPARIHGTVLIGATDASGEVWGPGVLNPYAQFQNDHPDALIGNSVLVYHGDFDVSLASAIAQASRAEQLAGKHELEDALAEAQAAVAMAPRSAEMQAVLGYILFRMNRAEDADRAFNTSVSLAREAYPDYQLRWILSPYFRAARR